MPFSIKKSFNLSFIHNKKNKPYSLQVLRQNNLNKTQNEIAKRQCNKAKLQSKIAKIQNIFCGIIRLKRVFLSTSYKGSMTIEASLVSTVFMLSVLAISGFLNVIKVQQSMRINLENIARKMAQTIYYEEQLYELGESTEIVQTIKKVFEEHTTYFSKEDKKEFIERINKASVDIYVYSKFVSESGIENITNSYIAGGLLGLDFSGSNYDKQSGTVELMLKYAIKLPYISQKFFYIEDCQKVYVKVWNGKKMNQDINTVYITDNGYVYHLTMNCPHISVDVKKCIYSDIEKLRNNSGAKYSKCELCGEDEYDEHTVVYVTDYGESVHTTLSCGGISRTVMTVDMSEIGDRALCKTCQGGDEK